MRHVSLSLVVIALGLAACARVKKPTLAVPKVVPTNSATPLEAKPTDIANTVARTGGDTVGWTAETDMRLKKLGLDTAKFCIQRVGYQDSATAKDLGDFLEFANRECPSTGIMAKSDVVWTLFIGSNGHVKGDTGGEGGTFDVAELATLGTAPDLSYELSSFCQEPFSYCSITVKDGKFVSVDY